MRTSLVSDDLPMEEWETLLFFQLFSFWLQFGKLQLLANVILLISFLSPFEFTSHQSFQMKLLNLIFFARDTSLLNFPYIFINSDLFFFPYVFSILLFLWFCLKTTMLFCLYFSQSTPRFSTASFQLLHYFGSQLIIHSLISSLSVYFFFPVFSTLSLCSLVTLISFSY